MTTSTINLANRQNFKFKLWTNQNSNRTSKSFDFSKKGNVSPNEEKNSFGDVIQFFKTTEIASDVQHDVIPAGKLYYKDSLVLKFSLAPKYEGYFPLLRGLFGFGKLSGLTVLSDKESKTFQIVISSGRTGNPVRYFEQLFLEVTREIKFKLALRDVLYVQYEARRIQLVKRQNLYNSFR